MNKDDNIVPFAEKTAGKQRGKPFQKGTSGNPRGKPKGARNRTTIAAMDLLQGEAESITRKAIDLALDGDITAIRLCLDRLLPVIKERFLPPLDLPPVRSKADLSVFNDVLLSRIDDGTLTVSEAADLACFAGNALQYAEQTDPHLAFAEIIARAIAPQAGEE